MPPVPAIKSSKHSLHIPCANFAAPDPGVTTHHSVVPFFGRGNQGKIKAILSTFTLCLLQAGTQGSVGVSLTQYMFTTNMVYAVLLRSGIGKSLGLTALPALLLQSGDVFLKVLCCKIAARSQRKFFDPLQESGLSNMHHPNHILPVLLNACSDHK